MERNTFRLPPITLLMVIVEFAIIISLSLAVTSQFLNDDPYLTLPGYEAEYLTSSAAFAAKSLQAYGYLPLWQPYLSQGEPLIDGPFSFVLNPFSSVPSLLYGSRIGIRYSVVLTAILAGLGGWALARMLGLGSLSRVLLGLLLMGMGNMVAMIGSGLFQLGVSQAYMAWIAAGTIGVLRLKHQRLSVVLTALAIALMFWAGNIYYVLPTLMMVVGLGITHIVGIVSKGSILHFTIDRVALTRLITAGLLTLGLSAVTFLPIFLQQGNVGEHPREAGAGAQADMGVVATLFFSDSRLPFDMGLVPGDWYNYQSFVLPFWFALLAFIVFPLIATRLKRPVNSNRWQVVSVGLFMIAFCFLWGTGRNPVIGWLYNNVSFFAEWRFVGRLLSLVSFWIAVLAVMQVDSLWQAVRTSPLWARIAGGRYALSAPRALVAFMVITSGTAAAQVIGQWKDLAIPIYRGRGIEDQCIEWLRRQYPDRELAVWTLGYGTITSYLLNDVRHNNIAAAYLAVGNRSTVFNGNLTNAFPEFAIGLDDNDRATLRANGYVPVTDSPPIDTDNLCLWQKADALPYAFTVQQPVLERFSGTLPVDVTTSVTNIVRYPDQIGLAVAASPFNPVVAVVQEVAYPGWIVEIDGKPANVESVGGFLGVVLPPGDGAHFVHFAYRPPLLYFGGAITLATAVFCIVYLLRLDRFIPQAWRARVRAATARAARAAERVLLSPTLFDPRSLPPNVPLLTAATPSETPDENAIDGEIIDDSDAPDS